MKKRYFYIVLIIFSLAFITFIVSGLAGAFSSQPQCKFVSLHQLLGADGLEMKWKLEGIKSAGYQTHDPYLMVKDGKIFFQGVINKGDPTQITILNAENGSFIATTEPTSYDTQFTTDGTALYIGIGHKGDLYKYDYATGQKVWSKHLGYVNGPCCFNIVNGELQMSWHLNHYYRVALDNGNIIMQNTREAVYREENEVFFYGLGANVLDAKGMEGKYIWRAFLNEEISQQPIFHNQTIFFRAGSGNTGSIYALNQATGNILWNTDKNALGSIAVSDRRVYYLRRDGVLLGVNQATGETETWVQVSKEEDSNDLDKYYEYHQYDYQVGYDDISNTVFLLTGDSGQLFAFHETR